MKSSRVTAPKTEQFVMRLSEEDRARLTALATEAEAPAAVVVRQLIRAAHEKLEAKATKRWALPPKRKRCVKLRHARSGRTA